VATSEKTWKKLTTYCFNSVFLNQRAKFDLAVCFNGSDARACAVLDLAKPNYVLHRSNEGFDIGAFYHAFKNTPRYDRYILLHDDHEFRDSLWFEKLTCLNDQNDDETLFGNLIYVPEEIKSKLQQIAKTFSQNGVLPQSFSCYIHGLGGLFTRRAIECLLEVGDLPYVNTRDKDQAILAEVISNFLLCLKGFKLFQIPPGYDLFLIHGKPVHLEKLNYSPGKIEVSLPFMEMDFATCCFEGFKRFLQEKLIPSS
jgi:hypothetical protein